MFIDWIWIQLQLCGGSNYKITKGHEGVLGEVVRGMASVSSAELFTIHLQECVIPESCFLSDGGEQVAI